LLSGTADWPILW